MNNREAIEIIVARHCESNVYCTEADCNKCPYGLAIKALEKECEAND